MKDSKKEDLINFLTPYAEKVGVTIEDIEMVTGRGAHLTIFIDKEGGVDLNTCEQFHNEINEPLDTLDPISGPYTLNVSSLGIDRPFKKEKDFLKRIDKLCEIKLYGSIDGLKNFEAVLKEYQKDYIVVEYKQKLMTIPLDKIARINEAVIF